MTITTKTRALGAVLLATLGLAGVAEAAPRLTRALQEQAEFLCERTEFSRTEIRALQKSADFPVLLDYALDQCPAVAAVLTEGATASVTPVPTPRDDDHGHTPDDGGGKKGY